MVDNQLHDNLLVAVQSGSSLTDLFLVLGLFSIVAGAMLIVGIFVMIAEERKGEMGMLRAIGLTRGNLVYTYYFEGFLYSLGSALAGTLLGLVVGFGVDLRVRRDLQRRRQFARSRSCGRSPSNHPASSSRTSPGSS